MNEDQQMIEHALGYTNEVGGLIMSIFSAAYDASLTSEQRAGRIKDLMNDIEHASVHSKGVMNMHMNNMHRRCINERS